MDIPFNLPTIGRRILPEETGIPDYAAAISKGLKLGYEPRNLENTAYASELENKINEAKAKYAMQQALADLHNKQAETGSIPFKNKLMEAQANLASQPKPIPGKLSNIERLRDRYAKGSDEWTRYDQALKNAIQGQNGITLYDPNGNPMVQIGGSSGGKGNGKGGGLYESPTGDQYQSPTGAIQTQLQNRIIGQKLVEPYLNNIIKTLPQFQSGWTQLGTNISGVLNKWTGTNFQGPSEFAKGQSSTGLAAEGMIRQFGLNATGHNLQRMEAILTPQDGESVEGYKNRAKEQLIDFIQGAQQAQEISRSGVPVKKGSAANITIDRLNGEPEKTSTNEKPPKNEKIDWSRYDIPPGYILLYKNGKPRVFPPELVNQKLNEGYDYE